MYERVAVRDGLHVTDSVEHARNNKLHSTRAHGTFYPGPSDSFVFCLFWNWRTQSIKETRYLVPVNDRDAFIFGFLSNGSICLKSKNTLDFVSLDQMLVDCYTPKTFTHLAD